MPTPASHVPGGLAVEGQTPLTRARHASVRQLDEPVFAERLLSLIASHGIEPDQIVLELTEQALALDFETAVGVVAELRRGGVSVLQMSESLDLQSIAEGIETVEQLEQVRALGCQLGQGFLFSRPVSAARIAELLAQGDAAHPPRAVGRLVTSDY